MLFGLHCTFALWAYKRLRFHQARKKPKLQGKRKTIINVAKFQAFYCNYFCLYVELGNNMGWSYNVRVVDALQFVDVNLLALEDNRHSGSRELNPLKLDNLHLCSVFVSKRSLTLLPFLCYKSCRAWEQSLAQEFVCIFECFSCIINQPRPRFLPCPYRKATIVVT